MSDPSQIEPPANPLALPTKSADLSNQTDQQAQDITQEAPPDLLQTVEHIPALNVQNISFPDSAINLQQTVDHSSSNMTAVIDAYEGALRSNLDPNLEDYLPASGADRTSMLVELLHVDLELRLRRGQPASVQEYAKRYPDLLPRKSDMLNLLQKEIQWQNKLGNNPEIGDYILLFPSLVDGIRTIFRNAGVLAPEVPGFSHLEKIGQGGMGVVYRAHQIRLNRKVALKMIRDRALGDRESFRRFDLEALSLGQLQHPNIVQVHDFGLREDGLPYFALEYCNGGSLAELMKKDAPSPRQAARLMSVLARAMGVAHKKGIVHRDLKPGNILLREMCDSMDALDPAWLKIADFGLAKITDDAEASRHTQTGGPMGTVYYMAPEQAINGAAAREPADIYALGVILYEMLTGRVPFRGKTQREILKQLEDADPLSISQQNPSCPLDLETICMKCLLKKPERRYASADALADDLQAFLDDKPISARRIGRIEKSFKWMRRNPGRTTAIGASGLLFSILIAGTLFIYQERLQSERRAGDVRLEEQAKRIADQLEAAEELRRTEEEGIKKQAESERAERARGLINQLSAIAPEGLGDLLKNIDTIALIADPMMLNRLEDTTGIAKARLELALLPRHHNLLNHVALAARSATVGEVPVYSERLKPFLATLLEPLWRDLAAPSTSASERLRLFAFLATWASGDNRWQQEGTRLASTLVDLNVLELGAWLKLMEPVRKNLYPKLEQLHAEGIIENASSQQSARSEMAAQVLATVADDPLVLARSATVANDRTFAILAGSLQREAKRLIPALEGLMTVAPRTDKVLTKSIVPLLPPELSGRMASTKPTLALRDQFCRKQARAIAALAYLGQPVRLWETLAKPDAPDLQAELRSIALSFRIPLNLLAERAMVEANPTARQNLLLLLGMFPVKEIPDETRKSLKNLLMKEFTTNPDPGIHAAIDWLLRHAWNDAAELNAIIKPLAAKKPPSIPGDGWRINSEGQTLSVLKPGMVFEMGAGIDDPDRALQGGTDLELRHSVKLAHGFEIGQREVSLEEFLRFRPTFKYIDKTNPDGRKNGPVGGLSWFDAVAYCQWLTEKEGIPEDQWCFPKLAQIKSNMAIPARFTQRTGYRLPTEEEWELAARASNTMRYPCGMTSRHINNHAFTWNNSQERLWPCGSRLPNAWGLFDTAGNALEWTMDELRRYDDPLLKADLAQSEKLGFIVIGGDSTRMLRGGSISNSPTMARVSSRLAAQANQQSASNGFRICRTTIPAPKTGMAKP